MRTTTIGDALTGLKAGLLPVFLGSVVLFAFVSCSAVRAAPANPSNAEFVLVREVMSGGGGESSGDYDLSDTAGQPSAIGISETTSGDELNAGFWPAMDLEAVETVEIVMPETCDLDGDGYLDAVKITFSSAVDDGTVNAGDFDIAGVDGESFSPSTGGDIADDEVIYLTFTDEVLGSGETPDLSYTQGTLQDTEDHLLLSAGPVAAVDKALPVIWSVDYDSDGAPPSVTFTFSETLETGTEDIEDWILLDAEGTTDLLAGLNDGAIVIDGSTVTITLAEDAVITGDPVYRYKNDGDGNALQDPAGNGPGELSNNNAPVADAGDNQSTKPRLVRLNASGCIDPDGNVLTYSWTQADGPFNLGITGATCEEIAFAGRAKGTYYFTLRAEDPFGATDEDTVEVTILNGRPMAKPGKNRAVDRDEDTDLDVVLEGCASRDPNSYSGYNDIVDYRWQWSSGPQEVTLTQDGTVEPLRVRPLTANPEPVTRAGFDTSVLGPGPYVFTLSVTDADGLTDEAEVEITVNDPFGNRIPIADAGMGLQQHIGSRILLDGHESRDPDGDPLTYRWEQVSGPPVKVLRSTKVKAMVRPRKPGTYVFRLIVNDGESDSLPATVTVEMTDPKKPLPVAEIMVAGAAQERWQAALGEEITLDGTVLGMDESTVTPAWSQMRGTRILISDPEVWDLLVSPVEQGVYVFRLDVTSGDVTGRAKEITVTVVGETTPPVADAGDDQLEAEVGDVITLDGSDSYDDDSGDVLDYTWTQLLGPAAGLSDPYTVQPTFTAAETGACLFQLTVFDGEYESAPDLVYVVVHSEDEHVPVAKVVEETITDGTSGVPVVMNGLPSFDADGQDTLVYQWEQTGGAMVVLDDPYSAVPSFTPQHEGTYVFRLFVDDSRDRSIGQTVTVLVGPVPADGAPGSREVGSTGVSCFIATAAYGTPFDDDVVTLRRFRDRFLLPTEPGRAFVELYYRYSPPAAEVIRNDEELRGLVRNILSPAVRGINLLD